ALTAADVQAIIGVQNAYAVAIDQRDWPALRACFAPHARVGFGRPARLAPLEEFLAWAPPFHAALGPTLHQVSTHHVRPDAGDDQAAAVVGGGALALAEASCYLHAVLVSADLASCQTVFGRYRDQFVHLAGRWVIQRREFHPTWRNVTTETGITGAAATPVAGTEPAGTGPAGTAETGTVSAADEREAR
ncbi:nuclear transport factor 2 family protein, partial [Candidatus Frankia nodulisporulans]|uniref:nuclear transport factor 2 family protein n=2 Tax=Candidatus Frankia nodulisporulans TaxID=2060052 RepID=UPI0013D27664